MSIKICYLLPRLPIDNNGIVIVADEIWRRARGPVATELLELVRAENADLVVAGGYGHSRLGEWIFGGVTHELLSSSPVCCMLSH